MCGFTAECCTVALRGPEPAGARGLQQASCERVSTFCNRKCDHGMHQATDAKQKKKTLWGLKCHVNSWVQPLNTSGVISTPFQRFQRPRVGLDFAAIRPAGIRDHNFPNVTVYL